MHHSANSLWLAVLAVAVVACGSPSEPYSRRSETADAPANAVWQHATASIHYSPSHSSGHGKTSAMIVLKLELARDGDALELTLDSFLDSPGAPSRVEFPAMLEPKFALEFSPKGDALALSVDGAKSFRMVSFATQKPLYCVHETFSLADGWSVAPELRGLLLSILASADPPTGAGTLHLVPGEPPRARGRFDTEFQVALGYACADLDDAELRGAVVASLVRPGSQIFGSGSVDTLVACVVEAVRTHPEHADELIAALKDAPPEQKSWAALALAETATLDAQRAMASSLAALAMPCTVAEVTCVKEQGVMASITWALATVSTNLGKLPADARDALLHASQAEHPVIRAHAVRGLALSSDDVAVARLRELAEDPCELSPDALPRIAVVPYHRLHREEHPPACWARAALLPLAPTAK